MKCHLLLGDWLSGRADMAPDISECTCGFLSFAVVEMCESGGLNPPSHYQFDVLHKIVFSSSFCAWFLYLDTEWFAVDIVWMCCWWLVKGVARPPICCVLHRITDYWLIATAADYRLTATAVWLGYFVWNGTWGTHVLPSFHALFPFSVLTSRFTSRLLFGKNNNGNCMLPATLSLEFIFRRRLSGPVENIVT